MKQFKRVTSPKGTLLARGEYNRQTVLAAMPGTAREISNRTGLAHNTVFKVLASLGRIEMAEKTSNPNPRGGGVEHYWQAIPAATPKLPLPISILKASRDPQLPQPNPLTPAMRAAAKAKDAVSNIWLRPVYTPPPTPARRQGALTAFSLSSRGLKT